MEKRKQVNEYSLSNPDIIDLMEKYKLTYTQARRIAMINDGFTFSEIAGIEGVEKSTIQYSVELGNKKIRNPGLQHTTLNGAVLRVNHLKEKYEKKGVEIEVYRGRSVSELGINDEPIHDYSEHAEVKDFEILSPSRWEKKFAGESTGQVEVATLVIVIGVAGGHYKKKE